MSKRTKFLLGIGVIAALVIGWQIAAYAGPVGQNGGFEDDDGNLTPGDVMVTGQPSPNFDWNSFSTVTWGGDPAPHRTATKATSGWQFTGKEDAVAPAPDDGFAGGTKQDKDCATVKEASSAPNKDDLSRIYLATKKVPVTVGSTTTDHVFLELAWVRTALNTVNASAHVGFEFNQGDTPCGSGSNGLIQRTAGDMLVVYDFEGSSSGTPTLTLKRWLTQAAGNTASQCETSKTLPCWGNLQNLTTGGFAEGKVNTSGAVTDAIKPPGAVNPQASEFGEAGIDLTAAGVFGQNTCTSFGNAYAVSRSSGNSSQAQMKDLVGPVDFNIQNCGGIIIRKETDPTPDTTNTTFDYNTTGGLTPATFDLKDGESQDFGNSVTAGPYSVTETGPGPEFALTDIDCSASDLTNGSTAKPDLAGGTVNIDLKSGDTVDCTFTNTLNKVASSMKSAQSFIPNDSATISAPSGGALAGTVTFTAFESSDCTGNVIHTEDVDLTGNSGQTETVSTTNTTHSTTATNVSWLLTYTSTNTLQKSIPATCLEKTALTIDNGGTATSS